MNHRTHALTRPARTALLALTLLAGCSTGTLKRDKELDTLLGDLMKRNQEIEAQKREQVEKSFRALEVSRSAGAAAVTMDLVDAPADTAFVRLMAAAGVPYRLGDVVLPGRVTLKTDKTPLMDAVKALTAPLGVVPQMRGDTLFLNYAPVPAPPAAAAGQGTVTRNFSLRFLTADSAWNLLNDLFPAPRALNFSKVPDLRSIYLAGPEAAVQQATDLLMRADRSPGSVQIEAIIISVNSSAYEEFNAQFSGITKGRISNGKINVWALTESSLEFNYNRSPAVKNPLAFSALLNMLFQQQKARIIARPFITAQSGEEAEMKIGENRYVVVQQPSAGAPVYGTQAIESGVNLKITPMVLGDNLVRLNIDMSNRQFVPTQGNVSQMIDNNSARTVLTLDDGRTAIIGGLKMKSVATANAGLPWLRRIPLLNLLTAAHEEDQSGQEVFFYLTPHIVRPGMEGLPDRPEAFGVDNGLLTPVEKLQR
ncbi:MAG: hypothetical protein HY952_00935 [Elusimicrobia bacterium]|nr:hypothetical protein [Elusimicrobiota bacterium]